MMSPYSPLAMLLFLALTFLPALTRSDPAPQAEAQAVAPAWLGCWQEVDNPKEALWFEVDRCGRLREGRVKFHRVDYSLLGAWLESWARATQLDLELKDGVLHVREDGQERLFSRADEIPHALLVKPYELPQDVEVDQDTIQVLQSDLRQREVEDQRVRSSPDLYSQMQAVDEDNTAFLKAIIQEVGWIDATRFGPKASYAAFLLVQHSGDLRLLRTALPLIEEDVKAERLDGQSFALLFDRLQLNLGYKQRYGSQISSLADGVNVLMPCEDFARVDELRATMGMGPLLDYLKYFESDGKKVARLKDVLQPPAH